MSGEIDKYGLYKIRYNNVAPSKGASLVAVPFQRDASFNKSVIFLVEHGQEGTVGFILNKTSAKNLHEVLTDIGNSQLKVYYGGPVARDTLHFIHTHGDKVPGAIHVGRGIYWGGSIDAVKELINSGEAHSSNIRFFIGYAGWGAEQLSQELKADSWLVTKLHFSDMINNGTGYMWQLAMHKMGRKYSYWTSFPDNPSYN
jgi:putative transcriptional regulator